MNAKTQTTMFSNNTDMWATPQEFYDGLNKRYNFTLDPCATAQNTKCPKFFTEQDNGLTQDWSGNTVYVNPPYSNVKAWVNKALIESRKPDTTVVMLVAARTDTKFFHDYCTKANQIFFIKGRLKFGGSTNSAPFPSMVVVFGGDTLYVPPKYGRMDSKANEL
jgi:site-specific DNA-methyltransferase (adenine-specific)